MLQRFLLPTLCLTLAVLSSAWAQQLVGSGGRALDGNLRLGSGGYNGASGGGMSAGSHGGGRGRGGRGGGGWGAHGLQLHRYIGGRNELDYYNAFQTERRYSANREAARHERQLRTPPTQQPVSDRFAEGWDAGYEAGLASSTHESEETRNQMEAISYGVGFFLGEEIRQGLERDGVDLDLETVIRGFRDGIHQSNPQIPRERLDRVLADVQAEVEARMVERLLAIDPQFEALHEENLVKSREFQQAFGTAQDVVTLPNGIQYKVLVKGGGPTPALNDTVVVNYRVLEFDRTVIVEGSGEEISVQSTTEGVAQVLQLMPVGSTWLISIPPELAYGAAGHMPEIGPNEALFGIIELLEIK